MTMNSIEDIKEAAKSGATVHWKNTGYTVKVDRDGDFIVACFNGSACILSNRHNPADFFVA